MNNYSFQFADSYLGFWNVPQIGRKIPGTLFIEKHSIRLELFWNNVSAANMSTISSATGYAYSEIDNKKFCFYFALKGLRLTYSSWFGHHQSKYKWDVDHFFMSDKPRFSINGILNCCIRTHLMDKWVWDYIKESYSDLWPFRENDGIELKYQAKPSLTLFESEKLCLYIKFSHAAQAPNALGFDMSTNTFLNLNLKRKYEFYDALDLAESVIWLFSLLWDNQFNPEFIEFRTAKSKFIYKQSDRYSYKYRDITHDNLITSISNFDNEELKTIIAKWFNFVEEERSALSTFFETQFNEHTTPATRIKNYVSVIDGLTRNVRVPSSGQMSDKTRLKKFDSSFKKIKGVLSQKEFNEIKMAILRESPAELKPRFSYLMEILKEYVKVDTEPDFCKKVIETRNIITHPKSMGKDVFRKEQYIDVAYCLEDIVRAYILFRIGVANKLALKIMSSFSQQLSKCYK